MLGDCGYEFCDVTFATPVVAVVDSNDRRIQNTSEIDFFLHSSSPLQ